MIQGFTHTVLWATLVVAMVSATWNTANAQTVTTYEEYHELEESFSKSEASDTTYVVNFWATWCRPCVKELPHFELLGEEYKDSAVKVVMVSLDFPQTIDSILVPFVKRKKLKNKVVALTDSDANSWINQVDSTWSGALPATLYINTSGRTFYEKSYETYDDLKHDFINAYRRKKI